MSIPQVWTSYYDEKYTGGNTRGWNAGGIVSSSGSASALQTTECGDIGEILGGAGVLGGTGSLNSLQKTFALGGVSHTELSLELQLVKIDSWNDGEMAFVFADSATPIWTQALGYADGSQKCGQTNANWNEHVYTISLAMDHTADSLNLTVRTNLDQDANNEAWGIAGVKIALRHSDVVVTPPHLTFDADNWMVSQTVVVTAVDDFLAEEVEEHLVTHFSNSSDPNYNGGDRVRTPDETIYDFDPSNDTKIETVTVRVIDNDMSGVQVRALPGLSNGTNGSYYIDRYELQLASEPFADVTLSIGATTDSVLTHDAVVFDNTNWSNAQPVVISSYVPGYHGNATLANNGPGCSLQASPVPINDAGGGGNISLSHDAASSDPAYDSLAYDSVKGANAVDYEYTSPLLLSSGVTLTIATAGTLSFEKCTYTASEASGNVTVRVTRSGGRAGVVSVGYAAKALSSVAAAGSSAATAGEDFTSVSGTFSFADGESVKEFVVPILNDDVFESPDEVFLLSLFNATDGANLGVRTARVTIADDHDAGCVDFTAGRFFVAEDGGSVNITVHRGTHASGTLLVNYTTFGKQAGPWFTSADEEERLTGTDTATEWVVVGDAYCALDHVQLVPGGSCNAGAPAYDYEGATCGSGDDLLESQPYCALLPNTSFFCARCARGTSLHSSADNGASASTDPSGNLTLAACAQITTAAAGGGCEVCQQQGCAWCRTSGSCVADVAGACSDGCDDQVGRLGCVRSCSANRSAPAEYVDVTLGAASTPMDYTATNGYFHFVDGATSATFTVQIHNDAYIENPNEAIGLRLFNPLQYTANGSFGGAGCVGAIESPGTWSEVDLIILDDGDLTWQALGTQIDALQAWEQGGFAMINHSGVPCNVSEATTNSSSGSSAHACQSGYFCNYNNATDLGLCVLNTTNTTGV
jgi:hypothetical protein